MTEVSDRPARFPVIDSVRAVALFGVIAMNIMGMVMALAAAQVMERATPVDYAVGTFDLVFLQGKARSTFAFLFGVGFGLLMSRTGAGFAGYYLRRMTVLLAIGVINLAFFFWGDILIVYALLGMVLMLFRGGSQKTLMSLGLMLVIAPPMIAGLAEALTGPLRGLSGLTQMDAWALMDQQAAIYRDGSYLDVMRANLAYYVAHNLHETPYALVYDLGVLGLFMLGLWTARQGIFADVEAHRPFLRRVMWVCLPVGFVISLAYALPTLGALQLEGWKAGLARAGYVGLPIMAFGYVAFFTLWFTRGGAWLSRALTPMGRMALTGYLASNLIGGFIWYGWGLGQMGLWTATEMNLLAVGLFVALCLFSAIWLKLFPIGPAEGIWRRLSGRRTRPIEGQAAES